MAIDPFQEARFSNLGLQFLEEAGVSGMVEHRAERSEAALPRLLGEGKVFDLAFVDGDHRFDGVFVNLFYLGRLVRPHGVVFLDDYQLRVAAFFVANLGWGLEEVSGWDDFHKLAVLRTSAGPNTRPYDFYVGF